MLCIKENEETRKDVVEEITKEKREGAPSLQRLAGPSTYKAIATTVNVQMIKIFWQYWLTMYCLMGQKLNWLKPSSIVHWKYSPTHQKHINHEQLTKKNYRTVFEREEWIRKWNWRKFDLVLLGSRNKMDLILLGWITDWN